MPAVSATISLPLPFHLVGERPDGDGPFPVAVAIHGFAMDGATMLALAQRLVPEGALLVAPQGPHSTLVPGTEAAARQVGYHWGVARDAVENRAIFRTAMTAAIDWAEEQGGDPARVALLGFSQPCSFAHRLALDPPHGLPFRGVVAICGGVPGEWLEGKGEATEASRATDVLHVSTLEDPWYPPEKITRFAPALAARFRSATHLVLPGGHRIPSAAQESVHRFLSDVLRP